MSLKFITEQGFSCNPSRVMIIFYEQYTVCMFLTRIDLKTVDRMKIKNSQETIVLNQIEDMIDSSIVVKNNKKMNDRGI